MLARVEDQFPAVNSDDEDEEEDGGDELADRLIGLDLDADTDKIWQKLTARERQEFEDMLKGGQLGNLVEIWTPWWLNRERVSLVQEIDAEPPKNPPKKNIPAIVPDIPDISKLVKSTPAVEVKYNVVNVLYSYAFVARLHNGGHCESPTESVREILMVSAVLGGKKTCSTASEAIQSGLQCIQTCSKTELGQSQKMQVSAIEDASRILHGPNDKRPTDFVLAALSDLHSLVKKARKQISKDLKQKSSDLSRQADSVALNKKMLFQVEKKLDFFLSWTQSLGSSLLPPLVPEIELEYCAVSTDLAEVAHGRRALETHWGGKVCPPKKLLIEEI